jgi:hypothetical protein
MRKNKKETEYVERVFVNGEHRDKIFMRNKTERRNIRLN